MGQITVIPCGIEGLLEIQPTVHRDARGYFIETYNKRDIKINVEVFNLFIS